MVMNTKYADIVLSSDETIFPGAFSSSIAYSQVPCRRSTPFTKFGIFFLAPKSYQDQATLYQF